MEFALLHSIEDKLKPFRLRQSSLAYCPSTLKIRTYYVCNGATAVICQIKVMKDGMHSSV